MQHFSRGDFQAALSAASDACFVAASRPEPHYAYGQAWLAVGQPKRAEHAFAAALQLRPRWADAWVNYGLAHYRQGAIEHAKTAMRQALAASPGHSAAAANLGAFMRISGESERAEALLYAALQADPGNVGARLNLVADLLQEERAADALALLDGGPIPTDARAGRHWYLQKSLALLQLRRADEAEAVLLELGDRGPIPPEIAPLLHWRHVLLAQLRGDAATARRAAETMIRSLSDMGPDAVLEHQIMAHYDLAKFWSGLGEHARAFAGWREGHALLSRMQPFSRTQHRAFVDASIAAFTPARFKPRARVNQLDPAPVFIVGMPRSGTTLCEQIIAAHSQAHGAGERVAMTALAHKLGGDGETPEAVARLASLPPAALAPAAEAYLAELHALAPGKTRIVDKMPGNYRYLGLIGRMFPGARIIHCVRDPRDIGLSIFTFRFYGAHGYAHDLADLGWTIAQHDRLMAHWRAVLPNPILTVKLADWVEDFDATLARVLGHLSLPPDPACARFYDADSRVRTVSRSQVRQPVNARGLGRWKPYAAQLAPLIAELQAAGSLNAWTE